MLQTLKLLLTLPQVRISYNLLPLNTPSNVVHIFTLAPTDLSHHLTTTTTTTTTTTVTGTNISLASGSSTDDQGISEKVKVYTIIITLLLDGLVGLWSYLATSYYYCFKVLTSPCLK